MNILSRDRCEETIPKFLDSVLLQFGIIIDMILNTVTYSQGF